VSESSPQDGVLDGDLYVIGAGDPLLATTGYLSTFDEPDEPYNDYAKLADAIKEARITQIHGKVVADESKFDALRYLATWPKRYITANEVGPLSALMVNDGFTGLSEHPDQPASIRKAGEPAQLAAETLTSLLEERGVHVDGARPPARRPRAPRRSPARLAPMRTNVRDAPAQRQHHGRGAAQGLAAHDGQLGTTEAGAAVVQDTLRQLGLPADGSVTIDGSGLDLGNRVTCNLLSAALDHQGPGSSLADDLPVAGESGTLRKRMRGTAAEGKVRAKTGTLNEVSALAGFAHSASGEDLTFAFIINGALPNAHAVRSGRRGPGRVRQGRLPRRPEPGPRTVLRPA
jgi:D-alanyl-D-alanine carboxypeptidase/D-alanyl-D-alanine-endopeptidase (penicillin-binding protein 4)